MRVGSINKVGRVVVKGASDGKLHYLTMFERVIQPLLELSAPHESTKRNSDPTLPSYYTVSRAVCNYTVKLLIRI